MPLYLGKNKISSNLGKTSQGIIQDTSDGNAQANDITKDKIAYVNGRKVVGTMGIKEAETFIPSTEDQVITAGQKINGDQIIKGDPNLVSENIPEGISLFGVYGTRPNAKSIFIINGSISGSNVTLNKTYTEILDAINTNIYPIAIIQSGNNLIVFKYSQKDSSDNSLYFIGFISLREFYKLKITNANVKSIESIGIDTSIYLNKNAGIGNSGKYLTVNSAGYINYSDLAIPIATSTVLGGVKPVAKTSEMTQAVGIGADGKLYTAKGGNEIQLSSLTNSTSETTAATSKAVKTAYDLATTANSTANTAKTNAASAQSTANTANTKATNAQTAAETAQSTANTAKSTAETAKTNAATAQSTANTAKSTAETAKTNAATAQSTANTAKETADNALNALNNYEEWTFTLKGGGTVTKKVILK